MAVSENVANGGPKTSHTTATKNGLSSESHSYSSTEQLTIVEEVVTTVRQKVCRLDSVDETYLSSTTIESFLEFITHERLTRVPHRGSRWDRVLKYAEYFALQISAYGDSIGKFALHSKSGSQLALANCRLLLELGPSQAGALEKSFAVFYKLALSISFFIRNRDLFRSSGSIREELAHAYGDLLTLVANVTVFYHTQIQAMSSKSTSLDFYARFGTLVDSFHRHKNHVADAMWQIKLSGRGFHVDIRKLRKWLGPRDQTLQTLYGDRLASRSVVAAEYTCEWSQHHLSDFLRSNDDVLTIAGEAGSGKSVLSGWIEQRLQRPLQRRSYETLTYTFEADIPSETTSLAFVKNLLLQLLERSVGDVDLYSQLVKCYEISTKPKEERKLEYALWDALEAGLKTVVSKKINLVLLIDGLDEIHGGDTAALAMHEKIHKLTGKYSTLRAVLLSRPLTWQKSSKCRELKITGDHTHDDIRRVIQSELKGMHFHDNEADLDKAMDKLVHTANGNFLWAILTVRNLKASDHQLFSQAIEKQPKGLEATIQKLVSKLDLKSQHSRQILAWLCVAERPMTTMEVRDLLQVDLQKRSFVARKINVQDEIEKACGPTVVIRQGIVRFRHGTIRQHLLDLAGQGNTLMPLKEAQRDLVMRGLTYAKFCLTDHDPAFEPLDGSAVSEVFRSHELLEYVSRYWIFHFRHSSLFSSKDKFDLPAEFRTVFPDTSRMAAIEWACWESQTSTHEAMSLHDLALRVRKEVFGESHRAVLQSLIVVGTIHRHISLLSEASVYFYRASRVAQSVLQKFSTVAITCTTTFLACTETIKVTQRTLIITHKEEMLKFIISAYKHQHGETSDIVIRYYKMLASLYVEIKEEHLATVIYTELHEIIARRFGKHSHEAKEVSEQLVVTLRKGKKTQDITEGTMSIFETYEETMDITDVRRILITIQLAESHEAKGDILLAEEVFINLWLKITEICRLQHSIELHIAKIDIALAYARFLRRCHRHEEASSILICVWTEYEHEVHGSETIIVRLKTIGELMRSIGLLQVAISVFTRVWKWFKETGKTEHEEAVSTTVLMSETIEEEITRVTTKITRTRTKTTTSTTTLTETTVSETVIREVFEMTLKRTITKKVQLELFKVCNALITLYISQKRWSEAVTVIQRSLEVAWKVVITGEGKLCLPDSFRRECVLIALRLASCHHHSSFEKAEQIYIRIYRACLVSLHVEDELLTQAAYALIEFYQANHRHEKTIQIYVELLEHYRRVLGATHSLTIKTLYTLGSLCVSYGRVEAYTYYNEIVTVLNKDSHTCHHEALEAAIILARYYYQEKRWTEVQNICKVVWETIVHHHKEHTFTEEIIESIYEMYSHALKFHAKVEVSVLYKLAVEYRQTCVKIWGASAEITVRAMLVLAKVCETIEERYEEAVTIYEEVIRTTKTVSTTTTTIKTTTTTTETETETSVLTTVKRRLTKLYVTIITKSSSTKTSTVERAIGLCIEVFEELKLQFGCAHEKTLLKLRDLVLLYKKLDSKESHTLITTRLQTTIIEIITKESSSSTLYEAARIVAGIYVTCGFVSKGFDLLRELRRQVIVHGFGSTHNFDIKIDHHHVGRVAYVFFVAFEETLRGNMSISYSEIMADMLTESIYYEQYMRAMKSEANVELILLHGSRMRSFLVARERKQEVKMLEIQMFEIFMKRFGSSFKTDNRDLIYSFYVELLVELGQGRRHTHIGHVACAGSNRRIEALLKQGNHREAYEIGLCASQFIIHQGAYKHLHNVAYGFRLSVLMACRGFAKPSNAKLHGDMLAVSREVIGTVFRTCKESHFSFVQIKIEELNDLAGLLGELQDFGDLEELFNQLWKSREAQKTWNGDTVINIGRCLVQARFSHNHHDSAIRLCEDICYNLRRVNGSLHPRTLEMHALLSKLYTSAGRFRHAMGVHEEVLRLVAYGDEDEDREVDLSEKELCKVASEHLKLLQRSHQRLGGWDKSTNTYGEVYDRLAEVFGEKELGVPHVSKWNASAGGKVDEMGKYTAPSTWEFWVREAGAGGRKKKPYSLVHRASTNWGCRFEDVYAEMEREAEEEVEERERKGGKSVGSKTAGVTVTELPQVKMVS